MCVCVCADYRWSQHENDFSCLSEFATTAEALQRRPSSLPSIFFVRSVNDSKHWSVPWYSWHEETSKSSYCRGFYFAGMFILFFFSCCWWILVNQQIVSLLMRPPCSCSSVFYLSLFCFRLISSSFSCIVRCTLWKTDYNGAMFVIKFPNRSTKCFPLVWKYLPNQSLFILSWNRLVTLWEIVSFRLTTFFNILLHG